MRDQSKRQYCASIRQRLDFGRQVAVAAANLFRQRPVRGRQALYGIRDPAPLELQSVAHSGRYWPVGKAVAMKGVVQKDAREIAREWSPGAIGAVHAWSQSHDQQARACCPEWRHGSRVIIGLLGPYLVEVPRETRAASTVE